MYEMTNSGKNSKSKGKDNTANKYVEAVTLGDLQNATQEAYKQKQTLTKEDIHAISLHKSKVANKAISDTFIQSCNHCWKGTNKANM